MLQQNTNVVELYSLIDADGTQVKYYNSGIGTFATTHWTWILRWLWRWIDNKIDLAIACRMA